MFWLMAGSQPIWKILIRQIGWKSSTTILGVKIQKCLKQPPKGKKKKKHEEPWNQTTGGVIF